MTPLFWAIMVGAIVALAIFLMWSASRVFTPFENMSVVIVFAAVSSLLFGFLSGLATYWTLS